MLSPAMETSNITPSVYSVHALTLLSEVNVSKCNKYCLTMNFYIVKSLGLEVGAKVFDGRH